MSHLILILLLAMLAGSLYLAWLVVASHKSAQRGYRRSTRKSPKSEHLQVSSSTKGQLLRMVQGDEEAAYRLVRHVKKSFPDKSEQWCWEKVIWDLERDRN